MSQCYWEVIDDLYKEMKDALHSGKCVSFPVQSDEWIMERAKKKRGKVVLERLGLKRKKR